MTNKTGAVVLASIAGFCFVCVFAYSYSYSYFGSGQVTVDQFDELGKVGQPGICGEAKYSDFLHLPNDMRGYFNYDEALACAKEQGKPLFVHFTGHAVVGCREMESRLFSNPSVLKILNEDFVVVDLYVDDKTQLPENEWITSTFDGRVKKTIGAKNLDFQICAFNANAQPLFCLLDNNEDLVAPPYSYDPDINKFIAFLTTGKILFHQRQIAAQINK